MLVDSGSKVSCLPASTQDFNNASPIILTAANNSPIRTYGRRSIEFKLGDTWYNHSFIVADVSCVILGIDFFMTGGKNLVLLWYAISCDLMRSQFSTLYHRTQYVMTLVVTLVKGDELPCE